jgi:hypothetical protein
LYRRVKTHQATNFQNVTQQQYGDAYVSSTAQQVAGLPIPPDVLDLLAPYRTPNL